MDKLTDTMTLQFKVKPEYKDIIFDDFKTGIIMTYFIKSHIPLLETMAIIV